MTYFEFNDKFYKQKFGLLIGNLLSHVLACLFLEFIPFRYRLPIDTKYFRYIDNILIYQPRNVKIKNIDEKLNIVESSINFTHEKESNNTIPFLDILLMKSQNNSTFKVYCTSTNKNDYIHFYSYHNNTIRQTSSLVFIHVHKEYVVNNT